jgi:ABC-2 type transport system permease protein
MKKSSTKTMVIILVVVIVGLDILMHSLSPKMSAASVFYSQSYSSFANLMVVIVTAAIMAGEFSRGTIKFLLIRPFTRTQILASKAITCFLFSILLQVIGFIVSLLSSEVIFGGISLTQKMAVFGNWTTIQVALMYVLANFILLLFYIAITLFVSTVFRSQSLAVGIGLAFLFGSTMINGLVIMMIEKYDILKFSPFYLLNIKSTIMLLATHAKLSADTLLLSFGQMTAGLIIYSIVIYFFTNLLFKKRDITLS